MYTNIVYSQYGVPNASNQIGSFEMRTISESELSALRIIINATLSPSWLTIDFDKYNCPADVRKALVAGGWRVSPEADKRLDLLDYTASGKMEICSFAVANMPPRNRSHFFDMMQKQFQSLFVAPCPDLAGPLFAIEQKRAVVEQCFVLVQSYREGFELFETVLLGDQSYLGWDIANPTGMWRPEVLLAVTPFQ